MPILGFDQELLFTFINKLSTFIAMIDIYYAEKAFSR